MCYFGHSRRELLKRCSADSHWEDKTAEEGSAHTSTETARLSVCEHVCVCVCVPVTPQLWVFINEEWQTPLGVKGYVPEHVISGCHSHSQEDDVTG